jgi:acyl-CoA reductase-like NAD-dependent aldehyde dehydrogenase
MTDTRSSPASQAVHRSGETATADAIAPGDTGISRYHEVDAMVDAASVAAKAFRKLDQQQVDAIVAAMVRAGIRSAAELARVAIEETGFGVFEDKVVKNYIATEFLYDYLRDKKSVGDHPGYQSDLHRAVQGDRGGEDAQRGAIPALAVRRPIMRAHRRDPARCSRGGGHARGRVAGRPRRRP